MSGRVFFDTNVLVYGYDDDNPTKQQIARDLLRRAIRTGQGVLSTQVLGEFFVTVTRKTRQLRSAEETEDIIATLGILPTVEIDLPLVRRAIETHRRYEISYWDSLIIAAAERGDCSKVLSEDMNHGQKYHEVKVENPFLR